MSICHSFAYSLLVLMVFAAMGTPQGFARTDQRFDDSLIGEWSVASSNIAGRESKKNPSTAMIRITKDQVQLIDNGETELELDCRLNSLKTPNEIDLAFELNKGNGPIKMSVKGIFKAEDGKVLLCFTGDPNGERPKQFEKATKENGFMVFNLKKAQPSSGKKE